MRRRTCYAAFALAALLLAGVVSGFASRSPDGLERVATDHGLAEAERDHPLGGSPLADYGLAGLDNGLLSGGLAGVVGVAVVLLVTAGLVLAVRRRPRERTGEKPRERSGSPTRRGS